MKPARFRSRIRQRSKPRRGRIVDKIYLAWVHTQPSIVRTHDPKCLGCRITAHHVKETPGAPKNDRRAVPLRACRHMLGFGDLTVEHSKKRFELHFGIDLEQEIRRLNEKYQREGQWDT